MLDSLCVDENVVPGYDEIMEFAANCKNQVNRQYNSARMSSHHKAYESIFEVSREGSPTPVDRILLGNSEKRRKELLEVDKVFDILLYNLFLVIGHRYPNSVIYVSERRIADLIFETMCKYHVPLSKMIDISVNDNIKNKLAVGFGQASLHQLAFQYLIVKAIRRVGYTHSRFFSLKLESEHTKLIKYQRELLRSSGEHTSLDNPNFEVSPSSHSQEISFDKRGHFPKLNYHGTCVVYPVEFANDYHTFNGLKVANLVSQVEGVTNIEYRPLLQCFFKKCVWEYIQSNMSKLEATTVYFDKPSPSKVKDMYKVMMTPNFTFENIYYVPPAMAVQPEDTTQPDDTPTDVVEASVFFQHGDDMIENLEMSTQPASGTIRPTEGVAAEDIDDQSYPEELVIGLNGTSTGDTLLVEHFMLNSMRGAIISQEGIDMSIKSYKRYLMLTGQPVPELHCAKTHRRNLLKRYLDCMASKLLSDIKFSGLAEARPQPLPVQGQISDKALATDWCVQNISAYLTIAIKNGWLEMSKLKTINGIHILRVNVQLDDVETNRTVRVGRSNYKQIRLRFLDIISVQYVNDLLYTAILSKEFPQLWDKIHDDITNTRLTVGTKRFRLQMTILSGDLAELNKICGVKAPCSSQPCLLCMVNRESAAIEQSVAINTSVASNGSVAKKRRRGATTLSPNATPLARRKLYFLKSLSSDNLCIDLYHTFLSNIGKTLLELSTKSLFGASAAPEFNAKEVHFTSPSNNVNYSWASIKKIGTFFSSTDIKIKLLFIVPILNQQIGLRIAPPANSVAWAAVINALARLMVEAFSLWEDPSNEYATLQNSIQDFVLAYKALEQKGMLPKEVWTLPVHYVTHHFMELVRAHGPLFRYSTCALEMDSRMIKSLTKPTRYQEKCFRNNFILWSGYRQEQLLINEKNIQPREKGLLKVWDSHPLRRQIINKIGGTERITFYRGITLFHHQLEVRELKSKETINGGELAINRLQLISIQGCYYFLLGFLTIGTPPDAPGGKIIVLKAITSATGLYLLHSDFPIVSLDEDDYDLTEYEIKDIPAAKDIGLFQYMYIPGSEKGYATYFF